MTKKIQQNITIPFTYAKTSKWSKRANKAIRTIRQKIQKTTKNPNIAITNEVNQLVWKRGKYKIPKKIALTTKLVDGQIRVYLQGSKLMEVEEKLRQEKAKQKKEKSKKPKVEEKQTEQQKQQLKEKKTKEQAQEKMEIKKG